MKQTTISARIETNTLEQFKKVCDIIKVNPSDFLRGCILELTNLNEPEDFLQTLGFVKKTTWIYEGKI